MLRVFKLKRDEKGQAMVEFALIFLILVMLVLGIVQFSMILSAQIAVTNAAREGARAVVVKTPLDEVEDIVLNAIGAHAFIDGTVVNVVTIKDEGGSIIDSDIEYDSLSVGENISVTLSNVVVKTIVPVPSFDNFAPGEDAVIESNTPFTLDATSTMRYEYREIE